MPPRSIFDGRRRPKGLEFSACNDCNQGARLIEQVPQLISRLLPDAQSPEAQEEVRKALIAIRNNHPGLLEELLPSERQRAEAAMLRHHVPENSGVVNATGPILNSAMRLFAAKLGLALHYQLTGRIVPNDGGVAVRWYSNADKLQGRIPDDFLNLLGPSETLEQGSWTVAKQFGYASAASENGNLSAHFAWFRESFAVAAFVAEDRAMLAAAPETHIFRPGFLLRR